MITNSAFSVSLKNAITNFGRSSEASEGSPPPSVIQGTSDDPLVLFFAPDVIISFNRAYTKENKSSAGSGNTIMASISSEDAENWKRSIMHQQTILVCLVTFLSPEISLVIGSLSHQLIDLPSISL